MASIRKIKFTNILTRLKTIQSFYSPNRKCYNVEFTTFWVSL
ncbi:hypothetical protein LEP1GSC125_1758 [Leptospira mayottensis 200901122]|uniref:Uncharacterized protein n=1 Tax=Leptospira mayottensis 200901122 TaxID=1193010 RepID=A0AA87MK09_9LEPT|nr:hypothetical protein LEP1GSC125_1758 [Leptospira mayottensis 200901122]